MNFNIHIFRYLVLFIFFLSSAGINVLQSQILPIKCYENQNDYSFMWWMKSFKTTTNIKTFAIVTSKYSFAFDYTNMAIQNLLIRDNQIKEESALRETNTQSFPTNNNIQFMFGMNWNGNMYWCSQNTGLVNDCQLVESGKYFQRRFINMFDELIGFDKYNSGLEIASWPDRLSLVLKAVPSNTLDNRGLDMSFTFPSDYSKILQNGNLIALENPTNGSGFIILKSVNTSSISVTGTTVNAKLNSKASCQLGVEMSCGMIIYPVSSNINNRLAEITDLETNPVQVIARQIAPIEANLTSTYISDLGWHQISLRNDGNVQDYNESSNSRIERVLLDLTNSSASDKVVRLNLAKGRLGGSTYNVFGITGISAVFRDVEGNPVGIPIQLSKNWHTSSDEAQATQPFRGPWYHGLSMITVPANSTISLEYTSVNALWGNVPAASHAQLSLVGWGFNQQWDQTAIGSWGETFCYEPDMGQAAAPVTDIRPLMVQNISGGKWNWSGNMGGADFFNYTKTNGLRSWHTRIRTHYKRYSPNLTEVTYAGTMDDNSMDFEYTTSIGRSDDLSRSNYHIKLNVFSAVSVKDFVVFQIASPTYHYTTSGTLAWGNETGLKRTWTPTTGGTSRYIGAKEVAIGKTPWFSFSDSQIADAIFKPANRGFIVRNWKAKINGVDVISPSFSEYYTVGGHGNPSNLINITLPANTTTLKAGDYIEADIELVLIPKAAVDYYGPNTNLIAALNSKANTWEMVYREAIGNDLEVSAISGAQVIKQYPVKIHANTNSIEFNIKGGRGYVPITITNVQNYQNPALYKKTNGSWVQVDQSFYGNDYWQTEYNSVTGKWEITYNVNLDSPNDTKQMVEFKFVGMDYTNLTPSISTSSSRFKIFPNPTKDCNINCQLVSSNNNENNLLKIFDLVGRNVFEKKNILSGSINTNLPSGIYSVSFQIENEISTQKLIVR